MKKKAAYVGLALTIVLAPGGFILGATLLAKHYRKRRLATSDGEQVDQ